MILLVQVVLEEGCRDIFTVLSMVTSIRSLWERSPADGVSFSDGDSFSFSLVGKFFDVEESLLEDGDSFIRQVNVSAGVFFPFTMLASRYWKKGYIYG